MLGVRAMVDDALGIVRIPGTAPSGRSVCKTTGKYGSCRLAQIDHVQATTARFTTCTASHRVRKSRFFVDNDVMSTENARIVGRFFKCNRFSYIAKLCEVENLNSVLSGTISDDIGVILIHLHIPPNAHRCGFRHIEFAQIDWIVGVGDVHERRLVGKTHNGVFAASLGVFPAPEVIGSDPPIGTEILHGHE